MSDQEQPSQRGEPKAGRPRMPVGYGIQPLEAGWRVDPLADGHGATGERPQLLSCNDRPGAAARGASLGRLAR
jgi:hypothetical protein